MTQDINALREQNKNRLIALAVEHLHLEGIACAAILLPGTARYVAIGAPAEVARLLQIAPAAQPQVDSSARDQALEDAIEQIARVGAEWIDDSNRAAAAPLLNEAMSRIQALRALKSSSLPTVAAGLTKEDGNA